jgi:hypothetical protein
VLHPIPSFTALRNVVKSYADRLGDKALKAALSKFPKKELYGSTRDAVVANRINGLNAFLHDLHAFSAIHTEVLDLYMASHGAHRLADACGLRTNGLARIIGACLCSHKSSPHVGWAR